MNNLPNLPTTSAKRDLVRGDNAAFSRRSFIRYFTVGAAAIAVEGCGGGGGTAAPAASASPAAVNPVAAAPAPSPAPAVVTPPVASPVAPVWAEIPPVTFTEGVPSSFSLANYINVADTAAVTLTLNSSPLPAGVTFNGATLSFDYDGSGTVNSTDGHVLTAIVG
jgi:hypothetical protein